MKWFIAAVVVGLIVFTCGILAVKADNGFPKLETMQQVRDFVMQKGEDKVFELLTPGGKVPIPYKEFRVGGVGVYGAWTFYILKASPLITRIIIYKPDSDSYVIVSEETEASTGGEAGFGMYIVTDNGSISWPQSVGSRADADALVRIFMQPFPYLIMDQFDYVPNPEDRSDLCWELKAKTPEAPEIKEESKNVPLVIPGGTPI